MVPRPERSCFCCWLSLEGASLGILVLGSECACPCAVGTRPSFPHSQVRRPGLRHPDVPQVRGLPQPREPAALPAQLPLRRVRLLRRQRLPVRRGGQLRSGLRPEGRARRMAGAQLLW